MALYKAPNHSKIYCIWGQLLGLVENAYKWWWWQTTHKKTTLHLATLFHACRLVNTLCGENIITCCLYTLTIITLSDIKLPIIQSTKWWDGWLILCQKKIDVDIKEYNGSWSTCNSIQPTKGTNAKWVTKSDTTDDHVYSNLHLQRHRHTFRALHNRSGYEPYTIIYLLSIKQIGEKLNKFNCKRKMKQNSTTTGKL